jgi:hypothetical protein
MPSASSVQVSLLSIKINRKRLLLCREREKCVASHLSRKRRRLRSVGGEMSINKYANWSKIDKNNATGMISTLKARIVVKVL